ncbi:hypothetical protein GT360_15340 [Vibrio astriarenae]|uniref:Uncharacterized protein n=1 Tax=Vibrio astriarenae TaxID=1481923 RepID=A0A7Z2YF98_9VIBR|nr:hypothetical protein [Vibrio astriarenae]QIA64939.1 hypothetical protein GT360_15340 [Vibrio astriarenae]
MKINKVALALSLSVLVTACDDDDVSTSSTNSTQNFSLSGSVIDGYIYNALVWIDANRNGQLDDSDPQAQTDHKGEYTLSLTEEQASNLVGLPILAKLTNESVDVGDTPPESVEALQQLVEDGELETIFSADQTSHSITLSMPPLDQATLDMVANGDEVEGQVINPFTTQVYEEVAETLEGFVGEGLDEEDLSALVAQITALVDSTVMERLEELKSELDIDDDYTDEDLANLMKGDFIDANHSLSNDLLTLATEVVENKKQDEIVVQQVVSDSPDGSVVTYESFADSSTYTPDNTTSSVTLDHMGFNKEVVSGTTITFETEEDSYRDIEGTPTLYSRLREKGVEDTSTGEFYATILYESDLNRDGTINFTSLLYDVGEGSVEDGVETYSFTRYIDEDDPYEAAGEYASWSEPSGRMLDYDSVEELMTAVDDDDLSGVDVLQRMTETTEITSEYTYSTREFTEYDIAMSDPFEYATYRQVYQYWDFFDGSDKEVISHDWQADGSFNQVITNEYDSESDVDSTSWKQAIWQDYYEGEVINYWQEWEVTDYPDENDNKVYTSAGTKYILDDDTELKLLNDADEGYAFNSWDERSVRYSENDIRTHVTWQHMEVDGYDFTFDGAGQKYTTYIDEQSYSYAEYWGPYIDDLPTLVDGFVEEDLGEQAIWLRVIGEALRGARSLESFESCEIELIGDEATEAAFKAHVATCGGTQAFTEDDLNDTLIARRKNSGTEVRLWDLYEGGYAERQTWTEEMQSTREYTWSINDDGHLVLTNGDFTRVIAAYHKFTNGEVHGAAVIVYDYEDGYPSEVWNTYFIDITGVWLPYDVTWN